MAEWRSVYDRSGDALVYGGEVAVLELQLQKPSGAGGWINQPLVNRTFVQSVVAADGTVLASTEGYLTTSTEDGADVMRFVITGDQTAAVLGESSVAKVNHVVSEILGEGRDDLAFGVFQVKVATAPGSSFPSPSVAHDAPATRYLVQQGGRSRVVVRYVGAPGKDGDPGGPPGPEGPAGPQGLIGQTGPAGPQGIAGAVGPIGPQGIQGPKGDKGDTGNQGLQGLQGPAGPIGQTGAQGPQGIVGPKGEQGVQGPVGPQGAGLTIQGSFEDETELPPTGQTGEAYLVDGDLYVWANPGWDNVGNIQGPAGADGAQGPAGPQGVQGQTGNQGPQGAQGPSGPQGEAGPQGSAGPPGAQGAQGPQGPQGATGSVGPQGPAGSPGATDADGVSYDDLFTQLGVSDVQGAIQALYTLLAQAGLVGGDGTLDFNNDAGVILIPAFV